MNPMYTSGAMGHGAQMQMGPSGHMMSGGQMMSGMNPMNTMNAMDRSTMRRRAGEVGFAPSPSRHGYMPTSLSQPPSARASPIARQLASPTQGGIRRGRGHFISRSSNNSPLTIPGTDPNVPHSLSTTGAYGHGFPYYDDPGSPIMDTRPGVGQVGPTGIVHGPRVQRSSRGPMRSAYGPMSGVDPMAADPYMMRDPRDRSLDRLDMATGQRHARARDRSLDRSIYLRDEHAAGYRDRDPMMDADPYRDPMARGMTHSAGIGVGDPRNAYSRDSFIMELQARLNELQNQYGHVKRELDATTQKLGSSMHSIKTFWSPELKKERALRKEEAAKYSLLSDQLKILRSENQVRLPSAGGVRPSNVRGKNCGAVSTARNNLSSRQVRGDLDESKEESAPARRVELRGKREPSTE